MPEPSQGQVSFEVRLRLDQDTVSVSGSVAPGPVSLSEFLPVLQSLDNAIVDAAERQVGRDGRSISCRAGCGACCRQMVPIGEAEAVRLIELMASMPPERRAELLERFRRGVQRLEGAGLLERIRSMLAITDPRTLQQLGIEYFQAGVPCPFLEDESCSIHPDRPLRCREYLVTSPAENCSNPGPDKIAMVPIARSVSSLLFRFGSDEGRPRWIPMILMLEWAEQHSGDALPRYDGRSLMEAFLKRLSRPEPDSQSQPEDPNP